MTVLAAVTAAVAAAETAALLEVTAAVMAATAAVAIALNTAPQQSDAIWTSTHTCGDGLTG